MIRSWSGVLDLLPSALGVCGAALIVSGYAAASRALLRHPDKWALLKKLYFGTKWPVEAPVGAALLIVAGVLCGFVALGVFAAIMLSESGDSGESPPPARQPVTSPIQASF